MTKGKSETRLRHCQDSERLTKNPHYRVALAHGCASLQHSQQRRESLKDKSLPKLLSPKLSVTTFVRIVIRHLSVHNSEGRGCQRMAGSKMQIIFVILFSSVRLHDTFKQAFIGLCAS